MRNLIRPTLFIIARLGLFLAVVAWVVGQWWQGFGTAYCVVWGIDNTGVAIGIATTPSWRIHEAPNEPLVQNVLDGVVVPADGRVLSLHDVALSVSSGGIGLCGKHWLIVTIFALFYGVLKRVYRKRGKESAADE